MNVDRCVCFELTFIELKQYAQRHGCRYEDLREVFNCGRGCGLCTPYIREMLKTGRTAFPAKSPSSQR